MRKTSITVLIFIAFFTTSSYAESFVLCEGEYAAPPKNKCAAIGAYTYCYTSDQWAAAACKKAGGSEKFEKIKLRFAHGDKCGYTSWRIVCEK
jgi:hypothetical protein